MKSPNAYPRRRRRSLSGARSKGRSVSGHQHRHQHQAMAEVRLNSRSSTWHARAGTKDDGQGENVAATRDIVSGPKREVAWEEVEEAGLEGMGEVNKGRRVL